MVVLHKKQTTRSSSTKTHVRFGIYNYFKHWYGIESEIEILFHCIKYYEGRTGDVFSYQNEEDDNGKIQYQVNQWRDRMFRYITKNWKDFRKYLSLSI